MLERVFVVGGVPYQDSANQTSIQMARSLSRGFRVVYFSRTRQRPLLRKPLVSQAGMPSVHRKAYRSRLSSRLSVVFLPGYVDHISIGAPGVSRKLALLALSSAIRAEWNREPDNAPHLLMYWWFFPELVSAFRWTSTTFDLIDRHWDYKGTGVRSRGGRGDLERVALTVRACGTTVAVSNDLAAEVEVLSGSRPKIMENGVDLSRFSEVERDAARSTKRAVYVGGLNRRLNFDLLKSISSQTSGWHLDIMGDGELRDPLAALGCYRMFGDTPYDKVIEHLATASLGLIPFVGLDFVSAASLLKPLDYLAAGLQVLATPESGILRLANEYPDHVHIVDSREWPAFMNSWRPLRPLPLESLRRHDSSLRAIRLSRTWKRAGFNGHDIGMDIP